LNTSLAGILLRFWLGLLGAVAGGLVLYRLEIFDPLSPAFKTLTLGSTFAGMLALWRSSARGHAVALAAGYALFCFGFVNSYGWMVAFSGVAVGTGLLAITMTFGRLAGRIPFGKFLFIGPMVGVLLFAATPMMEFRDLIPLGAINAMMAYGQLGWILGSGVAIGVEASDWVLRPRPAPELGAEAG
jgi:hypothetical protein